MLESWRRNNFFGPSAHTTLSRAFRPDYEAMEEAAAAQTPAITAFFKPGANPVTGKPAVKAMPQYFQNLKVKRVAKLVF